MLITIVLLLVSFGVSLRLLFNKNKVLQFMCTFPGPKSYPFIGNGWFLLNAEVRLANMVNVQRKYGNRVTVTLGSFKALMLFHPDDVAKVLTCKEMEKPNSYRLLFSDWLGSSLLYAKVTDHVKQRKMVSPAMGSKYVDNFFVCLNEHSKTLLNMLRINESEGKAVDIQWLLTLCLLDVILHYSVGKSMGILKKPDHEYAIAVHNESRCIYKRAWSPWLFPKWIWKLSPLGRKEKRSRSFLHDFMDKIVQERKAEFLSEIGTYPRETNTNFVRQDKSSFLDLLISGQLSGQFKITDKYIRDETNGFIFAGHDTSSSALTFAIYFLATHPDEQTKLQRELDEVFGNDKDRTVEPSDLPKLPFLDCCIKEALRLNPSIALISRRPPVGFRLDETTVVPKGVQIVISPWVTQRIPEFFPDPEVYMPSRFFAENSLGRHHYAFIPFSAGPRSCPGHRIALVTEKVILAYVFRNFTVRMESPTEPMVPLGSMIVTPKNRLKIRLLAR